MNLQQLPTHQTPTWATRTLQKKHKHKHKYRPANVSYQKKIMSKWQTSKPKKQRHNRSLPMCGVQALKMKCLCRLVVILYSLVKQRRLPKIINPNNSVANNRLSHQLYQHRLVRNRLLQLRQLLRKDRSTKVTFQCSPVQHHFRRIRSF